MNNQIAPIVYRQSLRSAFFCKRSYSGPVDRWMKEPDDPKYPKEKFKGMVGRPLNDDDYQIRDDKKLKVDLIPDTGYDYAYRQGFRGSTNKKEFLYNKYFFTGFLWAWVFWRIYWDYFVLLGEPQWTLPSPETFTDAELGIPSDGSVPRRIYHDLPREKHLLEKK